MNIGDTIAFTVKTSIINRIKIPVWCSMDDSVSHSVWKLLRDSIRFPIERPMTNLYMLPKWDLSNKK
jgi:hypothetical protein